MNIFIIEQAKQRLKSSPNPVAKQLFNTVKALRCGDLPLPNLPYKLLLSLHQLIVGTVGYLTRVFYWSPLFKSQTQYCGHHLYLYGGLPFIAGKLEISIGNQCRISGQTTITGRTCHPSTPKLVVGDNVDISWMTTIAVGNQVIIGNNVRIAGQGFLAGYPGHPLAAKARAQGLPETDDQVGDIVLEDDVWLATGVSVMAGVTIGKGSIIAASSVVTKDIPPGVLAAGVPAKVIKELE